MKMLNTSDGMVGFCPTGKVESDDIEKVMEAVDTALSKADQVSILADLREFDGMTPKAVLTDVYQGLKRLDKVGRISRAAVITDVSLLEGAAALEDSLFPGIDVKAFDPDHANEARGWVMQGAQA